MRLHYNRKFILEVVPMLIKSKLLIVTIICSVGFVSVPLFAQEEGAPSDVTDKESVMQELASGDDNKDPAKVVFDEATLLYSSQKYVEAANKFREANELKPSWKLHYNIAQAEAAAKRQGLAIEAFEKYLTEGGDDISVKRRDDVLREIERLRMIVGALDMDAPDGFDVYVDGVHRGKTPLLGRIRISASQKHLIELRSKQKVVDSRTIQVAGQETVAVTMSSNGTVAQTDSIAVPAVTTEQLTQQRKSKLLDQAKNMRIVGWVSLGVGGGLTLLGLLAAKQSRTLKEQNDDMQCAGDAQCEQSLESDIEDQESLRDSAIGAVLFGSMAMIACPILMMVAKKKTKKADALTSRFAPVVGNNYGGFMFETSF